MAQKYGRVAMRAVRSLQSTAVLIYESGKVAGAGIDQIAARRAVLETQHSVSIWVAFSRGRSTRRDVAATSDASGHEQPVAKASVHNEALFSLQAAALRIRSLHRQFRFGRVRVRGFGEAELSFTIGSPVQENREW